MTTTDHDPISFASLADAGIRLRHSDTRTGNDQPTGVTFPHVRAARRALIELAFDHEHAPGGVTIETDTNSPVPDALHVVIRHWDRAERYHLDTTPDPTEVAEPLGDPQPTQPPS